MRIKYLHYSIFVLAIPFFLIYQYLIALEFIGPFLGGYIGKVYSLLFFLSLCLEFILLYKYGVKFQTLKFFLILFLVYCIFIALYSFAIKKEVAYIINHLASFIYCTLFLLLFSRLKINTPQFDKVISFSLVLISLFFFLTFDISKLAITFLSNSREDFYYSYQFMALSILLIGVFSIKKANSLMLRFFIFLLISMMLFFNGARTELFYHLAFYFLFELSFSYRLKRFYFFTFLFFILLFILLNNPSIGLEGNRVVDMLENGLLSGSGEERLDMLDNAIYVISQNVFLGEYGAYQSGEYAHSIITVWADFGIIPFIFIVLAPIILLYQNTKKIDVDKLLVKRNDKAFRFALLLPLFPILLFAKTHEFLMLWVIFGLFLNRGNNYAAIHNK